MILRLSTKPMTLLGHLKRLREGTISENSSLKVVAIFLLLRVSSFFSIRIILLSPLLRLLEKYGLKVFQKGLTPFLTSKLLK